MASLRTFSKTLFSPDGNIFLELNSNVILNIPVKASLKSLFFFLVLIIFSVPCSMLFNPKGESWDEGI